MLKLNCTLKNYPLHKISVVYVIFVASFLLYCSIFSAQFLCIVFPFPLNLSVLVSTLLTTAVAVLFLLLFFLSGVCVKMSGKQLEKKQVIQQHKNRTTITLVFPSVECH